MSELEQIYVCAVRYALGRQTYITGVVSDYLQKQELSTSCKCVIARDIEECKDYGDDCDKEDWIRLLNKLKNEDTRN